MSIPYEQWNLLAQTLKPYVIKCNQGEITAREYSQICDQKYHKFVKEYSV